MFRKWDIWCFKDLKKGIYIRVLIARPIVIVEARDCNRLFLLGFFYFVLRNFKSNP